MFSANSRYAKAAIYTARAGRGTTVTAVRLPVRPHPGVRRVHRRDDTQRLDLVAAHYLGDASASWRLCDASGTLAPDALAARALVAVPAKEP
jgi:hypothetical protein